MSAIKDIVDLAKELEGRVKERRDLDVLSKIHSLAFALQSQQLEIMERSNALMQENAELKRQLGELNAEEVRIYQMVELRRGSRTGGKWMAFCPKCHMPAAEVYRDGNFACCTAECGWEVKIRSELDDIVAQYSRAP